MTRGGLPDRCLPHLCIPRYAGIVGDEANHVILPHPTLPYFTLPHLPYPTLPYPTLPNATALTVTRDEEGLSHRRLPHLRPFRLAGDEAHHLIAVTARRYFRVCHDHRLVRQVHGVSSACAWLQAREQPRVSERPRACEGPT